jgi:hypothetical protein
MTVALDRPLRREVTVGREAYTLTLTGEGLRLVRKGKRKGISLSWEALVSGDAALAAELRGSLEQLPQ